MVNHYGNFNHCWLGVDLALWKMMEWTSVEMITFPIWWESKKKCLKPPKEFLINLFGLLLVGVFNNLEKILKNISQCEGLSHIWNGTWKWLKPPTRFCYRVKWHFDSPFLRFLRGTYKWSNSDIARITMQFQ